MKLLLTSGGVRVRSLTHAKDAAFGAAQGRDASGRRT